LVVLTSSTARVIGTHAFTSVFRQEEMMPITRMVAAILEIPFRIFELVALIPTVFADSAFDRV
jgi:hypothetical protein